LEKAILCFNLVFSQLEYVVLGQVWVEQPLGLQVSHLVDGPLIVDVVVYALLVSPDINLDASGVLPHLIGRVARQLAFSRAVIALVDLEEEALAVHSAQVPHQRDVLAFRDVWAEDSETSPRIEPVFVNCF